MDKININTIKKTSDFKDYLEIRGKVFINEQKVPIDEEIDQYDRLDNSDVKHFLLSINSKPVGTLRILNYDEYIKIGRVAILKEYRNKGIGLKFLNDVINYIEENNTFNIKSKKFYLEAQIQVISFYKKLGFEEYGEVFLDANIEHKKMIKESNDNNIKKN